MLSVQTFNVKPTGLNIVSVSKKSIELKWNQIKNVSGYTLFRNTSDNANQAIAIAGFPANTANYIDTGLSPGTSYYYWVRAYNIYGLSEYSDTAFASTPSSGKPAKLKMKDAFFNISKGEMPEFSYMLNEDSPVAIKGRIVDLATGNIAYEAPETYMSSGEYTLIWEQAGRAGSGVYLIEFLIKRSNQLKFKTVARERFILAN